ncbi:GNAT family N-acetyltransferase [Nocardioides sp. NPDC058538]|uniref:GNAT family N-acetyltransferase n=1 Tax=Nocardioides sp. NPDC058538 TaxID=3346542 RepID=UPI00365CB1AA
MASAERLEISQVAASRTHRLRADVLHGGASPQVARIPGEDHPDVATYAAQDAAGTVIGCVTLFPAAYPDQPESADAGWRLRRLATAPGWRGQGVATGLLQRCLAHIADHGGGIVWCNATPDGAAVFTHLGFATVGTPWEDPEFGPNVRMRRTV